MKAQESAAQSLLQVSLAIVNTRYLASGSLNHYTESVDHAVGSTLEFASALLRELACEDDPYEDMGPESLTYSEAVALVSSFLERCCNSFTGPGPLPLMCMAIRAETFAFFLREPPSENEVVE